MTTPMPPAGTATASARKVVHQQLESVWDALVDHEAMSSWAPGLRVTLEREGTPDRNGVGAVRRISAPGPAPSVVEEITACERPHALGYRALSGVPLRDYAGQVTLREAPGGTEVTWTVSARPRLAPERLALAVLARVLLVSFVRALPGA